MKNHATQKFFEDLVTQELEHKLLLELEVMKEGMVAKTVGVLPEISIDSSIIDLDKVRGAMDYKEVLEVAIEKERQSFRLYTLLSGQVAEGELRETLLSLAEEEARHLMAFEEQYRHTVMGQW